MIKFELTVESTKEMELFVINTIENGEVIASEAFDNLEDALECQRIAQYFFGGELELE